MLSLSRCNNISIEGSVFNKNTASGVGGVLSLSHCNNISIEGSVFNKNTADKEGGVMHVQSSVVRMGDCEFTNNNSTKGSVIHATCSSIFNQHGSLLIANNTAKTFATMYLIDTEFMSENITIISHNVGSLMAFKSNVTFKITSYNTLASNQPPINVYIYFVCKQNLTSTVSRDQFHDHLCFVAKFRLGN